MGDLHARAGVVAGQLAVTEATDTPHSTEGQLHSCGRPTAARTLHTTRLASHSTYATTPRPAAHTSTALCLHHRPLPLPPPSLPPALTLPAAMSPRVVVLCVAWLLAATQAVCQVAPFAPASPNAPPFTGRSSPVGGNFYGRTYLFGGIGANSAIFNDLWYSSDDGANWSNAPNSGLPARYGGALIDVQTGINKTELLIYYAGADAYSKYNDVYFSVDGLTFVNTGRAAFSVRDGFATAIALPVRDQSGDPTLNGLSALFVLGGRTDGVGAINDVWYSNGRGQFGFVLATSQAPWAARCYHSAVPVESGTRIVVAGGWNDANTYYNDVWISDIGAFNWIQLAAAAPFNVRAFFGLVNIAEKLTLFGGTSNKNSPAADMNDIWSSLDYGRSWSQGTVNSAFTPRSRFAVGVNGKDVTIIDGGITIGNPAGVVAVLNGPVN